MAGDRFVRPDAEAVARGAAEAIALAISRAEGEFHLALAGGTTPKRTYELLAGLPVAWERVHLWFGDERCVPPDHVDSNYAMVRAALLERAPVAASHVHRMRAEDPDRDAARARELVAFATPRRSSGSGARTWPFPSSQRRRSPQCFAPQPRPKKGSSPPSRGPA